MLFFMKNLYPHVFILLTLRSTRVNIIDVVTKYHFINTYMYKRRRGIYENIALKT